MILRALVAGALVALALPVGARAEVYTVTSAEETLAGASCAPGSATCTLPQALLESVDDAAAVIAFAIGSGPQTITVSEPLVVRNQQVDGTTQPGVRFDGEPLIEVSGTGGPAVFDVSGGAVYGLAVNGTADAGIVLRGGQVYANRIGTDRLGLRTEGRFGVGVSVREGYAEVGSPEPAGWNVIATPGVAVGDGGYGSISGNYIGVAAGGGALLETSDPPGFGVEVCAPPDYTLVSDAVIAGASTAVATAPGASCGAGLLEIERVSIGATLAGDALLANGQAIELARGDDYVEIDDVLVAAGNIRVAGAGTLEFRRSFLGVNRQGVPLGGADAPEIEIEGVPRSQLYESVIRGGAIRVADADEYFIFFDNFVGVNAQGGALPGSAGQGIVAEGVEEVHFYDNVVRDGSVRVTGGGRYTEVHDSFLGVNPQGEALAGPAGEGVVVEDVEEVHVFGNVVRDGSVRVTGNGGYTEVYDNFLGVNAQGQALAGPAGEGVLVEGAARGSVSSNVVRGGAIRVFDSDGLDLVGNRVGVNRAGAALPVGAGSGIVVERSSSIRLLGSRVRGRRAAGGDPGAGILIGPDSVSVEVDAATEVADTEGLAVDLVGVGAEGVGRTPNDPFDVDGASVVAGRFGGNRFQNFPVVETAVRDGDVLRLVVALQSSALAEFRLNLFAGRGCVGENLDASSAAGGANVATGVDGRARVEFEVDLADAFGPGQVPVTAAAAGTATGSFGTSEMSPCRVVDAAPTATPTPTAGAAPTPSPSPAPAGASQADPTPTPTATPTPVVPVVGRVVGVEPVSGKSLVRVRRGGRFVKLAEGRAVPVGTEVDASKGRVSVTSADGRGKQQTAEFYGGRFRIGQERRGDTTTELLLTGPLPSCSRRARAAADKNKKKTKKKSKKKQVKARSLWGNGKGSFRVRGKWGSAAVRGTRWLTSDRCEGTLVVVRKGTVKVRDFTRRRTVTVRSGKRYLAPAKR